MSKYDFINLNKDNFELAKVSDRWWLCSKQKYTDPDLGVVFVRNNGETGDYFLDPIVKVIDALCDGAKSCGQLEALKDTIIQCMNHAHRIGHEKGRNHKAEEIISALSVTD